MIAHPDHLRLVPELPCPNGCGELVLAFGHGETFDGETLVYTDAELVQLCPTCADDDDDDQGELHS
jgi:hypothetical protein